MWRFYRIKKRRGFRTITEPVESLKSMLTYLTDELNRIPVSNFAHGFVLGRSIVTNAQPHVGQRYVLNMDVENFFPSIKKERMIEGLRTYFEFYGLPNHLLPWVEECCFLDGGLPQGSPSSPVLSNLYLNSFDVRLSEHLALAGYSYTRYADDITISGDDSLKERAPEMVRLVASLLYNCGLKLHPRKTKLMPYYQRQKVTGIVVNEKLAIPRDKKESLFTDLRGRILQYLDEHEAGYLSHVQSVDPSFYAKLCRHMVI